MLAEKQTSASETSGSAASRSAYRAASFTTAGPVLPDSASTDSGRVPGSAGAAPAGSGRGGAAARIRCAFVPLNPKLLTPATRRSAGPGQGVSSRGTAKVVPVRDRCGLSWLKCTLGGMVPWPSASTTLISPAIPAAASGWPMFVFAEPR